MQKGFLVGSSPVTMFLMLCFAMVVSVMIVLFAGTLLAPLVLGIPMEEFMEILNDGGTMRHINVARYMQTLTNISFFIIPAFIAAYMFSDNVLEYLGLRQGAHTKWFVATLFVMLTAIPCINMLVTLNEMIVFPKSLAALEKWFMNYEFEAQNTTRLFLSVDNTSGLLFNIFMMALLPAIGEELIFRGLLHKIFLRWTGNVHIAIIVTGLLFSLMHLQFYGLFPRWLLGVMFGYMLVWSGTIWLPVFAHFVNNAVIVVIFYFIHKEVIPGEIETLGTSSSDLPLIIFSTALCVVLLYVMCKKWRRQPVEQ